MRELDDRRIEVVVQSRDGGTWATQTPDRRFLPAQRETETWYASSPVTVGIEPAVARPGIGVMAANTFADLGVEGDLLCVIHETVNVGLTERCEGLASAWAGDVHLLNISDEPDRPAAIAAALAERQEGRQVGAILTLNANTALLALEAVQSIGDEDAPVLGTVGLGFPVLSALIGGQLAFAVSDAPQTQTYLSIMAMRKSWGEAFSVDAFAGLGRNVVLEARLLTSAALSQIVSAYVEALGPDDPFAVALQALLSGEGDAQSFSRSLVEIIEQP